jgi:flagellar secretion chaperone FliS
MNETTTKYPAGPMNPELTYLRNEVESADSLKLLLLLYNKLIRDLRSIRDRIGTKAAGEDNGNLPEDIGKKFEKCRHILSYLLDSLDPKQGEVATNLYQMYYFWYQKILAAQMEKDGRILDEILPGLETVREGWLGIGNAED